MKKYSRHWKKSSYKISLLAVLLLSGVIQLYAQNTIPLAWDTPLPADSSIRSGVFPNGLKYFLKHNNEPRDRAEFRLAVRAGSLQEEEDQLGVAHFVEHLAFNGTRRFEKNTLIDFIERNGSRFGADLNAFTSFDQTVYKLQVQTDSEALIDTALQVLADWAGGILFTPEEVDKERGIIRSEWRSGLSSSQRIQDQTYEVLYQNARYSRRFPIGDPVLIDTVSQQRLVDFYQRWYQPQNMAVVAVGNFSVDDLEQQLIGYFSPLDNRPFSEPEFYPLDTASRQRFLVATDEEEAFTRWELTYQLGEIKGVKTLGDLRHQLTYNLFSSLLNQRLAEIREQEVPPFTFASAYFSPMLGKRMSFRMSAMSTTEDFNASLERVLMESRRVAIYGFSEEELENEKAAILESYAQMVKELDKRRSNSIASSIRTAYVKQEEVRDLSKMPELVAYCLQDIQTTDLLALARSWQGASVRTAILKSNTELISQLPDSIAFFRTVDSVLQLNIPDRKASLQQGPLLVLEEQAGSAQLISFDTTLQLSTYELSNGIKIYLKATDFKNDQIIVNAFSPGGKSMVSDEDYPSASFLASIQQQSGLDTFRASELLKLLSDKQLSLSVYLGEYEEGLSGYSNQKDLATLFQLIYLHFKRPRFDSLTLANFQERQRNILESLDIDPRSAFGRLVVDLKYDYHPRRPKITLENIEAIELDRCREIYQERFANVADFQFIFIGNFSTDSLLDLATQYLAILPTADQRDQWQDQGIKLSNLPLDTTVIAGKTPKAEIKLNWHGNFPFADKNEQLHFIGLRQLLDMRLREELREEMSGVYGVRINSNYRSIPDSTHYTSISFNAEPEAVDTLITSIYHEIDRIANGDIKNTDLEKIKAKQLKSFEEALRSNSFWMGQIQRSLKQGLPLSAIYPDAYPIRLATLSAEGIAKAAKKYLQESIHFKFVLLPE
jgi:zinc protease